MEVTELHLALISFLMCGKKCWGIYPRSDRAASGVNLSIFWVCGKKRFGAKSAFQETFLRNNSRGYICIQYIIYFEVYIYIYDIWGRPSVNRLPSIRVQ